MGDGIMVTFGAALQTETFAADALRAVDDRMRGADDWNAGRIARASPNCAQVRPVMKAGSNTG